MGISSGEEFLPSIIDNLIRDGLNAFVVCSGSRNALLVSYLVERASSSQSQTKLFFHFEEREAGFFALGLIKTLQSPVAVVTTSGTAAAELFPSVIEAHYAGLPLVAITADRPPRFRGTGAPQCIDQVDLFGRFVSESFDLQDSGSVGAITISPRGPTHINICSEQRVPSSFDNSLEAMPFTESSYTLEALTTAFKEAKRPLVLVGSLLDSERPAVDAFLTRAQIPALVESLSGLTVYDQSSSFHLKAGERSAQFWDPDLVLRIGGVPTCRFWRAFEELNHRNVWSISARGFTGMPCGRLVHGEVSALLSQLSVPGDYDFSPLFAADLKRAQALEELILAYPRSEVSFMWKLTHAIPSSWQVYLGNSLPIREWDLVTSARRVHQRVFANRGANGIDGQISSAFGVSSNGIPTVGIVGDLTVLYGLSAPWIFPQLQQPALSLCIINNGGGRIFERVPALTSILTSPQTHRALVSPHSISFAPLGALWNLPFRSVSEPMELNDFPAEKIIEIVPSAEESASFWSAWDALG